MSRSLELFCGVGSRKSVQKAISVTVGQVERGTTAGNSRCWGLMASRCEMHYIE
jgi:hypothetical protein